jgi:DNA-binding NtrC family response regulator
MTLPWDILIVSSDAEARRTLATILNHRGVDPLCAANIDESKAVLSAENVGVVFCDTQLSDGDFREFLRVSRCLKPNLRVVITSRQGAWDEYLQAVRLGAFDVIAFPCRPPDVEWMLIQAKREDRTRTPRDRIASIESSSVPHPIPR